MEGSGEPAADEPVLFTNLSSVLVCHTVENEIRELTLYGKPAPAETWATHENSTIIAYFFKPFTVACLFDIPATEIAEKQIELSNWDAQRTMALKTQLLHAATVAEKIEVLDNLLKHLLHEHSREFEIVQYATDYMMCCPDKEAIATVLKAQNLNERTFQRLFKKYVGITPIQYRRICQFQHSFTQVKGKNFDKLADVAYDNGFADQSHFIRAFKEFTDTTPVDYLKKGLDGEK